MESARDLSADPERERPHRLLVLLEEPRPHLREAPSRISSRRPTASVIQHPPVKQFPVWVSGPATNSCYLTIHFLIRAKAAAISWSSATPLRATELSSLSVEEQVSVYGGCVTQDFLSSSLGCSSRSDRFRFLLLNGVNSPNWFVNWRPYHVLMNERIPIKLLDGIFFSCHQNRRYLLALLTSGLVRSQRPLKIYP